MNLDTCPVLEDRGSLRATEVSGKGGAVIQLKRAYEDAEPADGVRILVERLWPRGVSKHNARVDAWPKDLAPSTELRQWYNHVVERWPEFRDRYAEELAAPEKQAALKDLAEKARHGPVTFVFAAKDTEHNGAVVLKETIEGRFDL